MKASLLQGVLSALGAGLVWGLVFVVPVMLPDYPPTLLAFGRYLAFGAIALGIALRRPAPLRALTRRDWLAALELSLVGNLLYYVCLAAAIQTAGAALPTMIIGTLPVLIAVVSNLHQRSLPWRKLFPALAVITAGLLLVHRHELKATRISAAAMGQGIALAIGALLCWTWYPIRNARWLKLRPSLSAANWATAQGLATFPLAALGFVVLGPLSVPDSFAWPLGPRPVIYLGLMLAVGLFASWLGTLLWNQASARLPTALTGQLIVFETLSALAYAFLWLRRWPTPDVAAGIALLVLGVLLGVRACRGASA
jgi:drug/metabolite transporter (DMT)-like permease